MEAWRGRTGGKSLSGCLNAVGWVSCGAFPPLKMLGSSRRLRAFSLLVQLYKETMAFDDQAERGALIRCALFISQPERKKKRSSPPTGGPTVSKSVLGDM